MLVCPTCYAEYIEERELCIRDAARLAPLIDEPLRGHIIDRKYRLEKRLGSGGMASVYLATRLVIGDQAAIKILNRNLVTDDAGYRRFEQEARLAASVKHPNVVSIYDFGTTPHETAYLVMEYLEGPTLAQELRRSGGLSLDRCLEIFQPVCFAVDAAHKEGLIHRDIKPNNIILQQLKRGDEFIKVVDFGIAKAIDDSSRLQHNLSGANVFGTLGYMPFEQLLGQPLDRRADIYGLAVTLYQMLAARMPYAAATIVDLYNHMREGRLRSIRDRRPDISKSIEQVVMQALSPDRERRPATPKDFYQQLVRAIEARNEPQKNGSNAPAIQSVQTFQPVQIIEPIEPIKPIKVVLVEPQPPVSVVTEVDNPSGTLKMNPATITIEPLSSLATETRLPVRRLNFDQFVGRQEELQQLRDHYQRAIEGRTSALIIIGEPGIGKTQLLTAHHSWAEQIGAITRTARFFDSSGTRHEPFQIFFDMLAGDLPTSNHREALSSPQIDKWQIFEMIQHSVQQLAGSSPLVLFIEDLHWADTLSLELLGYLMRNSVGVTLQFIISARDEEAEAADSNLRHWLIEQSRYRNYELLKLAPLTKSQVLELFNALFGNLQIEAAEIDRLHRETAGNPYFLCEVLRLLQESGNLRPIEQGWQLDAIDQLELPASIINLVSLKLRRCLRPELEIFANAAVIGDEFSFETLRLMTGVDELMLEATINKGLREWVLKEQPPASITDYRFYHAILGRVLYNSISRRQRNKLHARAAGALEKVYLGNRNRFAGTLAYHYFQAGHWQQVFEYGLVAGDLAHTQQAMQPAVKFYEWVSEAISQLRAANRSVDSSRELKMRINYTNALLVLGRLADAQQEADRAEAAAQNSQSGTDKAWASYAQSRVAQFRGDFQLSATFANQGIKLLETFHGESAEIGRRILQQQGYIYFMQGELVESRAALERCAQFAQANGDIKLAGWALSLLGLVLAHMGFSQEGLLQAQEGLELLQRVGDRTGELIACERLGIVYDLRSQYQQALEYYRRGLTLAKTLAHRKQELTLLINTGENYRLQGNFEQAEQNYQQALALAQELDHRDVQSAAFYNLGLVELERGNFAEAAKQLTQALTMLVAQGRQHAEAEVLCDLGRARSRLSEHHEALDLFRAALSLCQKINYIDCQWKARTGMARCYLQLGDRRRARESYRAAITIIEKLRAALPPDADLDLFMKDKSEIYQELEKITRKH